MSKNKVINCEVTIDQANGDTTKLITKFLKKQRKCGILDEFKKKMYFVKPSIERRLKKLNKMRWARLNSQQENEEKQ